MPCENKNFVLSCVCEILESVFAINATRQKTSYIAFNGFVRNQYC